MMLNLHMNLLLIVGDLIVNKFFTHVDAKLVSVCCVFSAWKIMWNLFKQPSICQFVSDLVWSTLINYLFFVCASIVHSANVTILSVLFIFAEICLSVGLFDWFPLFKISNLPISRRFGVFLDDFYDADHDTVNTGRKARKLLKRVTFPENQIYWRTSGMRTKL